MQILCHLFGHHRCKRRARLTAHGWVSCCRWCGIKLIRIAPGTWRVTDQQVSAR